jgi:hypothetical protein
MICYSLGTMRRFLIIAIAGGVFAATTAWAHNTGQEARTPQQCAKLPGTVKAGMRAHCLKCITIAKNHYHPENPKGKRCRPDNGQP